MMGQLMLYPKKIFRAKLSIYVILLTFLIFITSATSEKNLESDKRIE